MPGVQALRRLALWQIYLGAGALLTALYVWVPPFAASGPVFNLLGLSPVVAIIVGVRRYKPASRGPWHWFAIGMLLFWLGDLYTYSYPRLFNADVPFPSLGDGAYVAVYPALMAGLLMLIRRRNPESDRAGVIDSLIMTLGLALLSWVALIAPYLHDETMTVTGKLVSVAYPLGDILLLAAAIRLAVDTGKRLPAFYLLASAIVALLVTDFAYGVVTLHGAYHGQVMLDIGWISFYLLWGAAALHPSMRQLEQPARYRVPRLTSLRLTLLTVASLIAPVVEATQELRRGNLDLLVIIAASVVLFGLVVLRMAGLVRQQERSVARERTLSAAGASLVAATGREEIYRAPLMALRRGDLPRRPDGGARALRRSSRRAAVPGRGGQAHCRRRRRGPGGPRRHVADRAHDGRRAAGHAHGRRLPRRRHARGPAPGARPRPRPRAGPQPARRRPRPARRQRRAGRLARAAQRPARRPARPGHADLPGPRERGADRGGPPPRERGALRLARPARQRPHHRPGRRRHHRLSEPLDRARPRLCARRRDRDAVRPPAGPRGEQPAAAPAGRRLGLRRERDRGARVLAAPHRRVAAPVRGPAHQPARGRRRPRDRAQQPRRQRAQGLRGAARPPGLPRPGHEPRQPRPVRRARAPRRRAQPPRAARHRRHLPRPRRLQDDQRQPRPRRGRRGPARGGRAPGHEHPRHRHRGALRRRRVRHPARGRRQRAGGGRHRRARARVAPGAAAARPEGDHRPLEPGHLGRRGRVAGRRRRAHPQRRRRDVHRQARRQGRLPPLRARDARGRARAPGAARRPPARHGLG